MRLLAATLPVPRLRPVSVCLVGTSVGLADCRCVVFELPVQTDRCVPGRWPRTCNLRCDRTPVRNTEVDSTRSEVDCPTTMTTVPWINGSAGSIFREAVGSRGNGRFLSRSVLRCLGSSWTFLLPARVSGPRRVKYRYSVRVIAGSKLIE